MACIINISDSDNVFKTIYEKSGRNLSTALSIYSDIKKSDDALVTSSEVTPVEKIKFILNSRLKNIDRLKKDKNQNKFKLDSEYEKFENLLSKLDSETDYNIYTSIKEQLDLIRKEINKNDVTIQQLENYFRILNKYANLSKEITKDEDVLEENTEIEKESSTLLKIVNKKIIDEVKSIANTQGITLSQKDMLQLEETNWAASRALDVTSDKNKFVQYIAKLVLNASSKRDITLKKKMDSLEEKRKKLGNTEKERLAKAQKY